MSNNHRPAAIVGSARIPSARSNGAYAGSGNLEMLTAALTALVDRFGLKGALLGEVAAGAVIKHSRDWNLTREAAQNSGLHPHTPASSPRTRRKRRVNHRRVAAVSPARSLRDPRSEIYSEQSREDPIAAVHRVAALPASLRLRRTRLRRFVSFAEACNKRLARVAGRARRYPAPCGRRS